MERKRLTYLYQQYLRGKATPQELDQWDQVLKDPALKEELSTIVDQSYYQMTAQEIQNLEGNRSEEIYQYIVEQSPDQKSATRKLWPRILLAAAVSTMIVSAGIWFFNGNQKNNNPQTVIVNDIAPGKQGATLTLANGKKIRLSEAGNGELAKEAGITIKKTANGELVYEVQAALPSSTVSEAGTKPMNTLTTAKGESYQVRLPDGSLVWLNAASSLTYSATLRERGVRRVKLDGEGYFEIAKDKAHPFVVETENQEVKVLGTHFNINAYADEPGTKTSLLEGSVQINNRNTLKPGQQALTDKNEKTTISQANVAESIAWKNGKFIFADEGIESIMRKLGRWYNVEVVYQGDFTGKTFDGSISRSDNISKILDKIAFTQAIHYKIEGRRIYIMP